MDLLLWEDMVQLQKNPPAKRSPWLCKVRYKLKNQLVLKGRDKLFSVLQKQDFKMSIMCIASKAFVNSFAIWCFFRVMIGIGEQVYSLLLLSFFFLEVKHTYCILATINCFWGRWYFKGWKFSLWSLELLPYFMKLKKIIGENYLLHFLQSITMPFTGKGN